MKVRRYSDLIVWQKAMDLVEAVYTATACFPKEELYSLTSQIRRSTVSVPSNIAEGQGRRTTADFLRHLSIAYGSLMELETQVLIAGRLAYLERQEVDRLIERTSEVGRLINGLSNSLTH